MIDHFICPSCEHLTAFEGSPCGDVWCRCIQCKCGARFNLAVNAGCRILAFVEIDRNRVDWTPDVPPKT